MKLLAQGQIMRSMVKIHQQGLTDFIIGLILLFYKSTDHKLIQSTDKKIRYRKELKLVKKGISALWKRLFQHSFFLQIASVHQNGIRD